MQLKYRDLKNAQAVAGIPHALGDLTEEEAVSRGRIRLGHCQCSTATRLTSAPSAECQLQLAFATMLSQEAEDQRRIEQSLEESLIADDLEHLVLDEEDSRYDSPGPSMPRHPRRRAGPPRIQHSDAASESSPPSSSSRHPPFTSSPVQVPQQPPDLQESTAWPLPSPSSAPSSSFASPAARISATPPTGSWASRAGAPRPSWSQVDRRPPSPAFPVLPAERDGLGGSIGVTADDMDEELQFALELSRAEEESRRGIL